MAIRFMQDISTCGAEWYKDWSSATGTNSLSGLALRPGASFTTNQQSNSTPFTNSVKLDFELQTTWLVQFRFQITESTTGNSDFLKFLDTSGNLRALLRYDTSYGGYRVILGDGSTVFASAVYACPADTTQFLEFKIVFNASGGGSAILKINGRTVISQGGTTVLSGEVGAKSIQIGNWYLNPGTGYFAWMDIVIIDGTGTPSDFLGDRRVDGYIANANGTYQDMLRSNPAIPAYQLVDDYMFTDTDYVYSDTDGHKSTFGFNNMSHSPAVIDAIQLSVVARRTDPGDANMKLMLKSGSTESIGSTISLSSSYQGFRAIYATDPDTGNAWTVSGVNAVEGGVEVDIP